MEELSKIDVSPGPLYEMWIMPVRSKVMMTGIGLKIFNLLTEPKNLMPWRRISTHMRVIRVSSWTL